MSAAVEVVHNNNDKRVVNGDEANLLRFGDNEKYRIVKNIAVLGFAFMIHFTAFHGTSNLQSSVHTDASLGTYTLAAIYGSLILSNIFLPVIVIRWLGCKWAIVFSFIAYMPYIAAQFYPRFYTAIPAGLAVGLGGGPLWCAKCTYLSIIAEAFSVIKKRTIKTEVLVVRFFGLFFFFYQLAQVFGNFISYSVLSNEDSFSNMTIKNKTFNGAICGANFCPGTVLADENPNLQRPDERKLNILSGIFLGCMVVASLSVAFGVDTLKRYDMGRKGSGSGLSGIKLLIVTLRQLAQKYQLLLLPITMFIGVEQAFIAVDFTSAFVACGLGISYIGYAMICFGLANAFAAAMTPALTKVIGRWPLIICVAVFHTLLIIWMLLWKPTDNYYTYCIIAACWGLADGIWLIQINALSGILFPGKEEAAFSNFRLWEATGSVITYALSPLLCTFTKLIAVLSIMIFGTICYSTIELLENRIKKGLDSRNFEMIKQNGNEHEQ